MEGCLVADSKDGLSGAKESGQEPLSESSSLVS
jgi:hypothetical protein